MCLCLATAACTVAPEPPTAPPAVLRLSERYDQPTANLDRSAAEQLFDESVPDYTELKTLAGLAFVRDVIARALKVSSVDAAALALDVQGSLAIHAACPGWDGDDEDAGHVDFVIGVDDSRVQRAFAGSVTDCKFIASLGGERAQVQASMQLEVDLGHSLALGDPVPAILLSASQLSAALSVELSEQLANQPLGALVADGLQLALDNVSRRWSLRLAGEDLVETLVELDGLDLGLEGTVLLGLRDDGSFNLRGRDSAWVCGSDGSSVCVRSD